MNSDGARWRTSPCSFIVSGRMPSSPTSSLLSVRTRIFSPFFSRTRPIQSDSALSSCLSHLAQPCRYWFSRNLSGRVAMQKVEGSSPIIRF